MRIIRADESLSTPSSSPRAITGPWLPYLGYSTRWLAASLPRSPFRTNPGTCISTSLCPVRCHPSAPTSIHARRPPSARQLRHHPSHPSPRAPAPLPRTSSSGSDSSHLDSRRSLLDAVTHGLREIDPALRGLFRNGSRPPSTLQASTNESRSNPQSCLVPPTQRFGSRREVKFS